MYCLASAEELQPIALSAKSDSEIMFCLQSYLRT